MITAFGETKSQAQWALDPRAAASRSAIADRIKKGWPPEQAITATPLSVKPRGMPSLYGEPLVTTSSQMTASQYEAILELARRRGVSKSELMREALDLLIAKHTDPASGIGAQVAHTQPE